MSPEDVQAQLDANRKDIEQKLELSIYLNKINLWIEEAKSRGNPAAARILLVEYHRYITHGKQPPIELMAFLADVFAQVINGEASFEQAAGLKTGRGKKSNLARDVDMYGEYAQARHKTGLSYEDVVSMLSAKHHLSFDAVRDAIDPMIRQIEHHNELIDFKEFLK